MNKIDGTMNSLSDGINEKDIFAEGFSINDNSSELVTSLYFNETDLNYNVSNSTFYIKDWRDAYKPIIDWLMLIILIVVMLSMGCEITWKNLLGHIKRPIGLAIGMFSQFGILPLSAYTILRVSNIQGLHATGVLIISCCPGGVLSNTFTYFCEGDLSLSVAMTCASTVMAMGMMPLNLWMYGRYFESEDLIIPYGRMAMSLIIVTSPVLVGMLMKWKIPRVASLTTKLGSYCGILIVFVCIGIEIALFPNMFSEVPAKLYIVILSLPTIGLTLGYGLALLLKRGIPVRRTLAIECGVQNVPLALTIVALSFPIEMQEDIILLPWLYGFSMMSGCTVICLIYHFYLKKSVQNNAQEDLGIDLKEAPLLEDTSNGSSNIKIVIKTNKSQNRKLLETDHATC